MVEHNAARPPSDRPDDRRNPDQGAAPREAFASGPEPLDVTGAWVVPACVETDAEEVDDEDDWELGLKCDPEKLANDIDKLEEAVLIVFENNEESQPKCAPNDFCPEPNEEKSG